MPSSENDDVVQTFASGTANESFTNGIHQRRVNCRAQDLCASPLRNTVEFRAKLVVIVPNDDRRSQPEWRDVPKLLRCPFRGWRTSDTNVHDSPRIDIDDEEREDWSEPNIVGLQEIAGPSRMVFQEGAPILSARELRWSGLDHMSLDRALCDSNAKFEKFATYSLGTPKDIFSGYAVNERNDLRVNSRSTALGILRPPTPEKPKSLAVPTEHRIWFHEQQGVAPMRQKARQQDNESTLMGLEHRTLDFPGRDDELLAKQRVLHQQFGPRASNIGNETSEHGKGSGGSPNRCLDSIEYSASYRSKMSNDAGQHESDFAQASLKFKTCTQRNSERSCGGAFM